MITPSVACGLRLLASRRVKIAWKEEHSMKKIVALLIGLALLASTQTGWAGPQSRDSGPQEVAYGAGSFLGTLVYAPFKVSFCILGAITSASPFRLEGSESPA